MLSCTYKSIWVAQWSGPKIDPRLLEFSTRAWAILHSFQPCWAIQFLCVFDSIWCCSIYLFINYYRCFCRCVMMPHFCFKFNIIDKQAKDAKHSSMPLLCIFSVEKSASMFCPFPQCMCVCLPLSFGSLLYRLSVPSQKGLGKELLQIREYLHTYN